jgi:hypothetical protein
MSDNSIIERGDQNVTGDLRAQMWCRYAKTLELSPSRAANSETRGGAEGAETESRKSGLLTLTSRVQNSGPGAECEDCVVYRVHAAWRFVLVITEDESLIRSLAKRENELISFRFARRGYDASRIISVWRPAVVIFGQAILETLGVALLDALASDQRTLGARILVAVRKGAIGYRCRGSAVFATVEEPFHADEIVAIIDRTLVETLPPETAEGVSKP